MTKITTRKQERALYTHLLDKQGNLKLDILGKPILKFTGKFKPALPKMLESAVCRCHKKKISFLVSDGQAINIVKECRRQIAKNTRFA